MIDDLLDATRIETGKLQFDLKPSELQGVLSRITKGMGAVATEAGVLLHEEIEADLPTVVIDEARIAQVLRNLLSNAFKFTPRGGKVTVSARREEEQPGWVTVAVTDTGRGIPKEHLDRIFERMYQVKGSDSTAHGGMGLGLSICKELVGLHRGTLQVESEFGKGTTFFSTVKEDDGVGTSPQTSEATTSGQGVVAT